MAEKSLIIIPTYNERENIIPLVSTIFEVLPQTSLLIVDDASPDGTGRLVEELSQKDARINVLHRPSKLGLGTAYLAGFRWGLRKDYSFFIEMDADFSHHPRYLGEILRRAQAGADVVLGSRYVAGGGTRNWGIGRKILSKSGSLYARMVLGVSVKDLTGGFKCFRRRVLESINLDTIRSEGYSFQIEMTYRALKSEFSVEEMPIIFDDRRVGQSKMSHAIFLEAIWMVWHLRLGLAQRKDS